MHTTIDKVRDQDRPGNTRKLIPHAVLIYEGKSPTNHIYIYAKAKQFVVEGKAKNKDWNSLYCAMLSRSVVSDSVRPHGL